jgi:hypothetical protein
MIGRRILISVACLSIVSRGALAYTYSQVCNAGSTTYTTSISCIGDVPTKGAVVVAHSSDNTTGYSITSSWASSVPLSSGVEVNNGADLDGVGRPFSVPGAQTGVTWTGSFSTNVRIKNICVSHVAQARDVTLAQTQTAIGSGTSVSVPAATASCPAGYGAATIASVMVYSTNSAPTLTGTGTQLCGISNCVSATCRATFQHGYDGGGAFSGTLSVSATWAAIVYRLCLKRNMAGWVGTTD